MTCPYCGSGPITENDLDHKLLPPTDHCIDCGASFIGLEPANALLCGNCERDHMDEMLADDKEPTQ